MAEDVTQGSRLTVGIVNGKEAKTNSRPYMVSIQLHKQHVCGGFLISDPWVLTAAHCWEKSHILTVVVGTQDLRLKSILNHFTVKDYIQHEEHQSRPYRNDLFIAHCTNKIKLNVKCISLPKEDDVAANTLCGVAGWGLQTNGQKCDRLMEANVTTKKKIECHLRWGAEYVASQMICVYGSGGSCRGDSGGLLVCGDTAVGITSFGDSYHCNLLERPNMTYISEEQCKTPYCSMA
ncbi:complement factor D-like [Puntigrus tetrazona]|uniref:complement factor D-like n=1 Tax=Puntigrus tetrazona TaxID=1606681 RepID=UPI001C89546A|nr:complement factor D-like [Puntigrus tetrazona]